MSEVVSRNIVAIPSKNKLLSVDDFRGSFDEVLEYLYKLKLECESVLDEGEWCEIDTDYVGYDGGVEVWVKYFKYETEETYMQRVAKLKQKQDAIRIKELETFRKLKEKYGE